MRCAEAWSSRVIISDILSHGRGNGSLALVSDICRGLQWFVA